MPDIQPCRPLLAVLVAACVLTAPGAARPDAATSTESEVADVGPIGETGGEAGGETGGVIDDAATMDASEPMPDAARQSAGQPVQWPAYARAGRQHMRLQEWAEAEASFEAALAALPEQDPTGIRRRTLAGQIALLSDAAWDEGRLEDAARLSSIVIAAYDHSKATHGSEEPLELATHLRRVGVVATLAGRYEVAEEAFDRALAIRVAALGRNDRQVVEIHLERAQLFRAAERYDEAEAELGRALAIVEGQVGAEHERTVPVRLELGELRMAQGRFEDARAAFTRAKEIEEAAYGENSPAVATTLRSVAKANAELGKNREAEQAFEASLAILDEAMPEHPMVAIAENDYAWFLVSTDRPRQAMKHIAHALEILEARELDGGVLGAVLDTRARANVETGRIGQAEADYRLAIAESSKDPLHHRADAANATERLAELLRGQGREAEADALLAEGPLPEDTSL